MTRRPDPGGDAGSSLILVLIIITVLAVVTSVVLTFVDTSLRATVALRDQAASSYAADGAGQIAVDALRLDKFHGTPGDCLSASDGWALNSAYPGQTAYISCAPGDTNPATGPTAPNASTGSAVLTLGTGASGEDGIYVKASGGGTVKIRGGVFSNSTITVAQGTLSNTITNPYTIARGACTGTITPAASTTCGYGATVDNRGVDPGTASPHGASYDPPAAPTTTGTISRCGKTSTYQQLTPGRYSRAADLTGLTGCGLGIVVFQPGTYFFDFTDPGSHVWTVDRTYVIAGTTTIPLTATPSPAQMPTACVPPGAAGATPTSGVQFVFGGDSQVVVSHHGNPGGQLTICASNSNNGPPVAVYGLKTALGGALPVSAQSGCVVATQSASKCPLISTDLSPDTTLTIQGTTYAPRALVDVNLNNNTDQMFRWGVIVRALAIRATGSAGLTNPVVEILDSAAGLVSAGLVTLDVYVCPAPTTCTPGSDRLRLRAKVLLTGTSPQTVQVLSWSRVR